MELLDIFDWINYIVEVLMGVVFALLCFRQAGKDEDTRLFFLLLSGFFGCVFMSDFFFVLLWMIEDYPFVFSAGDISWVGGYLFLIAAALCLMDGWTREWKEAARRYSLPALAAPAVCVAFNVFFIYSYPEITVNYLLYAIPTVILLYQSLRLYLAGQKAGIQPGMQRYHFIVLGWLALQMVCDLFTTVRDSYIHSVIGTALWYIVMFAMPGIYFSAKKGVRPVLPAET